MWIFVILSDPAGACSPRIPPPEVVVVPPSRTVGFPVDGVPRVLYTSHDPEVLASRLRLVGPGGVVPIERIGSQGRIDLVPEQPLEHGATYTLQRLFPYADGRPTEDASATRWLWYPIAAFETGDGPPPPAAPEVLQRVILHDTTTCGPATYLRIQVAPQDRSDVIVELEDADAGVVDIGLPRHEPLWLSHTVSADTRHRLRVVARGPAGATAGPWFEHVPDPDERFATREEVPPRAKRLPGPSERWPEGPTVVADPACASLAPAGQGAVQDILGLALGGGTSLVDAADLRVADLALPDEALALPAQDGDGAWLLWHQAPGEVRLARIDGQGGLTSTHTVLAAPTSDLRLQDAAVDAGLLAFAWRAGSAADPRDVQLGIVDLSTGELAWSTASDGLPLVTRSEAPAAIAAHRGRWHVAWAGQLGGQWGTWLSSVPRAGGRWDPASPLSDRKARALDLVASPAGLAAVMHTNQGVVFARPGATEAVPVDHAASGDQVQQVHLSRIGRGWLAAWSSGRTAWAASISAAGVPGTAQALDVPTGTRRLSGAPGGLLTVGRDGEALRWSRWACSTAPPLGAPPELP